MMEIKAGSDYFIRDPGVFSDWHLHGKRVTALENGGGWGNSYVDVRCGCCGKVFEHVGVDRLE